MQPGNGMRSTAMHSCAEGLADFRGIATDALAEVSAAIAITIVFRGVNALIVSPQ
jgi:hypothetical protein